MLAGAAAVVAFGACDSPSAPTDQTLPVAAQTPTPTPSAAIDTCLIGTWVEVANETNMNLTGVGGAEARIQGAGRTLTFRPDGTELVDYGDGVTYSGRSADGVLVERTISGTVEYRVTTREGVLRFLMLTDDTAIEYRSGGRVVAEGTFGESSPVEYTCTEDTHTQRQGDAYRAEYRRAGA